MSLLTVSRFQGTCVSKLIKWLFLCGSLSAPLDTPLKAVFSLLKVFRHGVWRTWARHDFFVGEEVEQTLGHISCSFSCTISKPSLLPAPPPTTPSVLSLLSKHKNKTKSSSFLSGKKNKLKPRQLCLNSPVLLSTQLCQHLFPLSVVKMQMPSSFFSLLSLDNCETCYHF